MLTGSHLRNNIVLSLISTAFLCLAADCHAGKILSPVSVIRNDFTENATSGFAVENVINQSGLVSNFVSGDTDYDTFNSLHMWETNFNTFASAANPVFPSTIDFDLGRNYSVWKLGLWNMAWDRGIEEFNVYVDTRPDFSSLIVPHIFTATNIFDRSVDYPRQDFDLGNGAGDPDVGRYVRIVVNSAYFNDAGPFFQFGEIAFDVTDAPIPEPSTFPLALMGIFVSTCYRRRNTPFKSIYVRN